MYYQNSGHFSVFSSETDRYYLYVSSPPYPALIAVNQWHCSLHLKDRHIDIGGNGATAFAAMREALRNRQIILSALQSKGS